MPTGDELFLILKNHKIELSTKTIIMGILNLSQDSPIKSSIASKDTAIERAHQLKNDGATIIDIGAHSTAAMAKDISTEKEIDLVVPIIKSLVDEGFLMSCDTWNSKVAYQAAIAGVHIINDINGLQNSKMVKVVKDFDVKACIMHMRGAPKKHYEVNQHYNNISKEISEWFHLRLAELEKKGINREKLLVDPGFEFGKSMADNLILLNNLNEFSEFKLPILVSASRKAFIAEAIGLGRIQEGEGLLEATLAVQTISSFLGAHILRVHDVKNVYNAIKFVNRLKKQKNLFLK